MSEARLSSCIDNSLIPSKFPIQASHKLDASMKRLYDQKTPDYYQSARKEILPLLPESNKRVLEIGCGEGATLEWLKQIRYCEESWGIELTKNAAETAKTKVDKVIVTDIENDNVDLPKDYFDLILCLDVLEHLQDPWRIMSMLVTWLRPQGTLLASIPNIRYRTVLFDLALRGKFDYVDSGILDRTHLRFFTRESSISLFESADLTQINVLLHPPQVVGKASILNGLTFGYFRDMFSWQILISGKKIMADS
jgi:2-polyprenyl-3-methyl-5-hydroxy-6-metoxy-1,4-benzoquinol methylase